MNRRTRRPGLTTAHRFLLVALWVSLILVAPLALPGQAHADGGAPNLAYVTGGGTSGNLVVIDIGQRRVTGRIPLGGDPEGVVLSVDGGVAYVAQAATNRIAAVDVRGRRVLATVAAGSGPDALVLDVTGSSPILWVADGSGDTVTLVDPDTRRVLARIPVGQHPTGLAIAGADSGIDNPNDPEVYVANADSDTVSVLSVTRRQAVATIPVLGGPVRVVVPATGGVAYVGTRAGAVWALSVANHRLLGMVLRLSGGAPGTMDYDAVTGQIFVPDAAADAVDVLAPVAVGSAGAPLRFPAQPVRTLHIGGGPAAVAITFDGAYGFVAERSPGRVAMLDVGSHRVLDTIDVAGTPTAVVTGPYPPAVSGLAAFIIDLLVIVLLFGLMGWGIFSSRRSSLKQHKREG